MTRCLRSQLRALLGLWWLPLLPPALGLLLGWEAAAALGAYTLRAGPLSGSSALAFVLDIRHFVPLAGAAWAAAYLGAGFDGRSASFPLSRGYGRFRVFGSQLLIFFLGCSVLSLAAQASALRAVPGLGALPAGLLLRCLGLRLLLDLGMAAPCAAMISFAGTSLYGRALPFLYGLLLWRLMGSHYALWLPEAGPPGLSALWPLAALPLSLGACAMSLGRKEL